MVLPADSADHPASAQMNAELRHAQLEMLSAQCATDRLRLRYSTSDLARTAQRDILRKAWSSASALFEYYDSIVNQMPDRLAVVRSSAMTLEEAKVLNLSERMARYLQEQRERFRPIGQPLQPVQREAMAPFFSPDLVLHARIVILDSQRIPKPPLDLDGRAAGSGDFVHPFAVTFKDVLVFHDEITNRRLFHALVHTVQTEVLGLEAYAERLTRAFLRSHSHAAVPFEAHATLLRATFAEQAQPFSVEEKVRLWLNQGRY